MAEASANFRREAPAIREHKHQYRVWLRWCRCSAVKAAVTGKRLATARS